MSNKTEIEKQRAIAGVSYDLSYLWVKLGKYATENRCDLTIEVFQNQETAAEENYTLCDFKFNVSGTYLELIDFIEAISKDQELSFIPENLKMYSDYADVTVDEDHYGAFAKNNISDEEDNDVIKTSKGTILMLKTEFYKTNVPVYKSSLSKVENQLTVEQEKAAAEAETKNGNTTNNTTNNTNNTANTTNTANSTNTTNTTN